MSLQPTMLTKIVADRPETEARMAIGATWVAVLLALPVFEPDVRSPFGMVVGALVAAGVIVAGFAAASRVRPMSQQSMSVRVRRLGWSLILAALMAVVNLGGNLGLASLDPTIHRLLVERFDEISPAVSAFAAPVIEEVVFRLVCLSVIALVMARFVKDRNVVFWTAVAVSAFVFGVIHVLRPEPESLELAWIYKTGVTLKSSIGGVLLGWIYWRWGLVYSIACHGAVNGIHSLLEPLLFAAAATPC